MIGAYTTVKPFAYPGWRLTVPGGPAGGQYKGFTHTESAGTDLPPQDQYEQDREDGMSSHDLATASLHSPRGVYRSSAEVPPRPNASGKAMTYTGEQTEHHAGEAVAPGSFPADYTDSPEDAFVHLIDIAGLGAVPEEGEALLLRDRPGPVCQGWGCNTPGVYNPIIVRPGINIVQATPTIPTPPSTGATSVVNQPAATPTPTPPAQAVSVPTTPPVSPTPAPIVATNEVVPLNDGSGNYLNISTGATVPASTVQQNPATMQLTTSATAFSQLVALNDGSGNYINPQTGVIIPGSALNATAANTLAPASTTSFVDTAETWLEGSTLISGVPNWGIALAAAVGLALIFRKKR